MPPSICSPEEPQWDPHRATLAHAGTPVPWLLPLNALLSSLIGLDAFDISDVLVPLK